MNLPLYSAFRSFSARLSKREELIDCTAHEVHLFCGSACTYWEQCCYVPCATCHVPQFHSCNSRSDKETTAAMSVNISTPAFVCVYTVHCRTISRPLRGVTVNSDEAALPFFAGASCGFRGNLMTIGKDGLLGDSSAFCIAFQKDTGVLYPDLSKHKHDQGAHVNRSFAISVNGTRHHRRYCTAQYSTLYLVCRALDCSGCDGPKVGQIKS